jgi:hypothetical protein
MLDMMKLLASVLVLLGGGMLAACDAPLGCEGVTTGVRSNVEFAPSTVEATRTPASCGLTEPAFSSDDRFTLEVTGATDVAPPYTTLTLEFPATAAIGEEIPLSVETASAGSNVATASSIDGTVTFTLSLGSDGAEIDSDGLASVVVTVDAIPTADGKPLSAEVQLYFLDGRELDQTYSGSLRTAVVLCPSG